MVLQKRLEPEMDFMSDETLRQLIAIAYITCFKRMPTNDEIEIRMKIMRGEQNDDNKKLDS